MEKQKKSLRKWWREMRPTKTVTFWSCIASIILTIIVGFVWGGWVTKSTADRLAQDKARDAVVERLVSICVAQFNQDPEKDPKLQVLKETTSYQRREYIQAQGWATIPGDQSLDRTVSDECVKLLMLINP